MRPGRRPSWAPPPPSPPAGGRRALALTLLELDPEAGTVEQRLTGMGVHPAVAREATTWAWDRHAEALQASRLAGSNGLAG